MESKWPPPASLVPSTPDNKSVFFFDRFHCSSEQKHVTLATSKYLCLNVFITKEIYSVKILMTKHVIETERGIQKKAREIVRGYKGNSYLIRKKRRLQWDKTVPNRQVLEILLKSSELTEE